MTGGASFRVDMHVKVLGERVVARAKRRGMDALVYAPHFRRLPAIRERAAAFSDDDLLVVPAREVFTGDWRTRKHVLALGLEEPIPDFITLAGAMAELARQDAAVLVPHPEFATVSLGADDIAVHRESLAGIEVYNPKHWRHHTERAKGLASQTGLAPFGSSYAHLRGSVGEAWTEFETNFETAAGLAEALREAVPRRVYHRPGVAHQLRRRVEFAHLFYENSLSKAYLLAKGAKPTNPNHPAYGGRFEDVKVYERPQVRGFADR